MHLAPSAVMATAFLGAYALETVSPGFAQLTARVATAIKPVRWARQIAAAQDIGASAKAVWIIGVDGKIYTRAGNNWQSVAGTAQRIDIDQNGRPRVVNDRGNIYVHDNNMRWQKLPGTAVDVAVDVPGVARIVGKDGKTYVYNEMRRNWDAISQGTDSEAIGAGGGEVFRLTKKNDIYQLR